jgi:hypothetical protein
VIRRVRAGEWLAGAAGLVLIVSLFVDWYGGPGADGPGVVTTVVLALLGLSGPALLAVQATRSSPALPAALSVVVVSCGALATLVVLVKLVLQPGDNAAVDVAAGAWIALVAALGLLAAGWRSMGTERNPGAPVPRVEVRPAPPAAG